MATLNELLERRAEELLCFFKRRFGREYRRILAHRGTDSRSLNSSPNAECSRKAGSLAHTEKLARTLGFVASDETPQHIAFERNFFPKVSKCLTEIQTAVYIAPGPSVGYVLREWVQHKHKRRLEWSDVIPANSLEILHVEQRMRNPSLAGRAPRPPRLDDLLRQSVTHPPAPKIATGGQSDPPISLGGPREN
jgi:hypothetical protein